MASGEEPLVEAQARSLRVLEAGVFLLALTLGLSIGRRRMGSADDNRKAHQPGFDCGRAVDSGHNDGGRVCGCGAAADADCGTVSGSGLRL